ncbi:MAG: alkaline phosphatase family protein [bacterium]
MISSIRRAGPLAGDPPPASRWHLRVVLALALLAAFGVTQPAGAYIGPGAGFALLSSFMSVFVTAMVALAALLLWPFRSLARKIRHRGKAKPLVRRVVVVGLDGQDPNLTDRFLAEGKLPNFAKLAATGCYRRLRTTFPSVSPVAWSSFATGVQPGKHNIFDFLDRDRRTYLPVLSSTRIGTVTKFLKIGKWRIPRERPELTLLRRSKPFWTLLGESGVWSTVLRVPITFPPDRFHGAQLGAMSIPDLLGTQGTFLLFTTRASSEKFKEGGQRVVLKANGRPDEYDTVIEGPDNSFLEGSPKLGVPMSIRVVRSTNRAVVTLHGHDHVLEPGKLTDWVTLTFPAAPLIKITGLTRMMVTEIGEHFSLYMTPISIDPEHPAMPISHPDYYATYLAKKVGPFSTLGLAEDTWALNEKVVGDGTFLKMTWDIDEERRRMFFAALDRCSTGSVVCVFDATDRIQHMFWRYIEEGHPAARATNGADARPDAIEELYRKNDELVGRVMAKMKKGDVLFVCSDHGFTSFRRGVNLNRWLLDHGYLFLKEGGDGKKEWLEDVDWSRTKAYCLGLTGMFLNVEGREGKGIVKPGEEVKTLKAEIMAGLSGLRDEAKNEVGVVEAFDTAVIYRGPYVENAPDLLIGYNRGYRTSWDCATGVVAEGVFEDNVKAWSGDHCVDPRLVPGVLFSNRNLDVDDPALIDIAPTTLTLFGVKPPPHMEGKPLFDLAKFARGGAS